MHDKCGHQCTEDCHEGKPCPPCQAPCDQKCEHSACKKKCFMPCDPCIEKCTWLCPHEVFKSCPYPISNITSQDCDAPCGAPCTRVPCEERCLKELACGHQCPSVCGEPCPSKEFCQVKFKWSMIPTTDMRIYPDMWRGWECYPGSHNFHTILGA